VSIFNEFWHDFENFLKKEKFDFFEGEKTDDKK
jgi:hypothetical protein